MAVALTLKNSTPRRSTKFLAVQETDSQCGLEPTLTVELLGVSPLVWRRLVVPRKVTLPKLHRVIQEVMGWED
jgi:hypothetical protein